MDWIQVFTIVVSLAGFIYWMKSDLKGHIDRLDADIGKVDKKIEMAHRRMDQLYQVIIDLLKSGR